MGVSFYDFSNLHDPSLKENILSRYKKIIDDGSFIEGEYNQKFEKEFAQKQGAKHCLLVGNGTDALEIALLAGGVRHGDYVGVPGITFYASAEAIINIGATPVFIDVDYNTGLICINSLKRVLDKYSLKAVMPVHIYGLPADIVAINEICKPYKTVIVEDAAQAHGAVLPTGPVGSSGNLTTFSFYPTKNLSAFGDAGCILTDEDTLAEEIKSIRNHGRGFDDKIGRNSRCDHLQAAILHLKLKDIDEKNMARKKSAALYHRALEGAPIDLVSTCFLETSSWHLYPIQLRSKEERLELQEFLKTKEISTTSFYELALSQELPLRDLGGEREVSEKKAGSTLCLPIHPFLSEQDIMVVAKEVKAFFK